MWTGHPFPGDLALCVFSPFFFLLKEVGHPLTLHPSTARTSCNLQALRLTSPRTLLILTHF